MQLHGSGQVGEIEVEGRAVSHGDWDPSGLEVAGAANAPMAQRP